MSKQANILVSIIFLTMTFSGIAQTNDKPVLAKYAVSQKKKDTATHTYELKRYAKTDNAAIQRRNDSLQKAHPPQLIKPSDNK